jgi:hypothetical protein
MVIGINGLRALSLAKRIGGIDFDRTVTLGRHEIFFTEEDFAFIKARGGLPLTYDHSVGVGQFAESLFKKFGASEIESIDASGYEGASIIMDFNQPVSGALKEKYTLFADFGSIEHIFNISQAIENISSLLAQGGGVIIQTQANGFAGHGFYQLSPEFFYSAFSEANGFGGTVVFLVDMQDIRRWYLVPDPQSLAKRNAIPNRRSFHIFCISAKSATVGTIRAQQSDYELAWQTEGHSHMGEYRRGIEAKLLDPVSPFLTHNARRLYYTRRALKDFRRESVRFDPDFVSQKEFDKLRYAATSRRAK